MGPQAKLKVILQLQPRWKQTSASIWPEMKLRETKNVNTKKTLKKQEKMDISRELLLTGGSQNNNCKQHTVMGII